VILQKIGTERRFLVLDAAMNDLVRPAMYDAWHGIVPVSPTEFAAATAPADVVGPVCESGDTFARNRGLPMMEPGSLAAFLDAGAYGAAMSSTYNARPLAAEILVDGTRIAVVRERQDEAALLAGQRIPDWMAA
jgi:diaminopimelate decarboxylase